MASYLGIRCNKLEYIFIAVASGYFSLYSRKSMERSRLEYGETIKYIEFM